MHSGDLGPPESQNWLSTKWQCRNVPVDLNIRNQAAQQDNISIYLGQRMRNIWRWSLCVATAAVWGVREVSADEYSLRVRQNTCCAVYIDC